MLKFIQFLQEFILGIFYNQILHNAQCCCFLKLIVIVSDDRWFQNGGRVKYLDNQMRNLPIQIYACPYCDITVG